MSVTFHNEDCNYRLQGKRRIAQWLDQCSENENVIISDISIIFCSSDHMLALNRDYLGHDYHTDIITFDYCDEAIVPRGTSAAVVTTAADPTDRKPIAGDLFIGVETVADNARELGIAPRREMLRVIVHGVLHLCGYGDKTPEEARAMREKEDLYLNRFDETQL